MYKNLAATLVAACCFSPVFSQTTPAPKEPLKIGFVYVAPLTDAGWVRQHDEGRKAVEAALGSRVTTSFVENVAEGPDAERVIRDLAQQGHKLIFTTSYGYMDQSVALARILKPKSVARCSSAKTAIRVPRNITGVVGKRRGFKSVRGRRSSQAAMPACR